MTKLEMVLGTALVGVTGALVTLTVKGVKYAKQDQQLLDEIQGKCDKIKNVMKFHKEVVEKEEA